MSKSNASPTRLSASLRSILFFRSLAKRWLVGLALPALFLLLAPAARAQVTMAPFPVDLSNVDPPKWFVGANYSGTYSNYQIRVILPNTQLDPIFLEALNPPAGVTMSFLTNNFTNSSTVMLLLAVTNLAKGTYPITIQASNTVTAAVTSSNLVNILAGVLWVAPTNGTTPFWSLGANWSTGVTPVAGDDVLFEDAGFNTNILDASFTVGSLIYIRNNSGATHATLMVPGTSLSVTGTNGFAENVDSIIGNNKTTTVFVTGTNSSLTVSNPVATFVVNSQNGAAAGSTLNMQFLDRFAAYVNQFGFCDVNLANQGAIGNQIGVLTMARTNVIRGGFVGNYNGVFMTNAITFFNNGDIGNNGSANTVNMGISNIFLADSMRISLSRVGSGNNTVRFNPAFNGSNAIAIIRNTDGVSRMSLLGVAVDSGANNSGNNSQGNLDFRNGTADVLVDTMWAGRFRTNSQTAGGSARGFIFLQNGLIDVNNLILGYQAYTNEAFCQGTLTVNGPGTFRVNNTIELGHTTGSTNLANVGTGFGRISVTTGIVSVATITLGDLANGGNTITLNQGGRLIVSNTVASASKWLTTLTMNNGSTLQLHINGLQTTPYFFVTNLTVAVGQANVLKIGSIQNLVIPPGGTNIPLFLFGAGGANFAQVVMPAGLQGSLLANGPNQIDLAILANTPKNIVWRGGVNNDWDTTTKNWLDLDTLVVTNFVNGDSVFFDDTAAIPTTINLALPILIANSISMTNTANNYTFTNGVSGSLQGSATLTKTGTGSFTMNGSSTIALQINQGSLLGNGSVGSANIAAGATINFSGTIASGLTCGGSGTFSGTASGALSLLGPSGTLTNAGTINGSLSFQSGTLLVNSNLLNNIGSSTVASNATLINAANIGANFVPGNLTVIGLFKDLGLGTIYLDLLTVGNRGRFIPGGDGIGMTVITPNGVGTFPGRVALSTGSTNLFKVDPVSPANTVLRSGTQDFGPSQNTPMQVNGCTILISNVTVTPFAAGQTFKLFGNSVNGGDIFDSGASTNSYPFIEPVTPGPGLSWDLSQLRPGGIIGIRGVGTNPINVDFTATLGQLITTNGGGTTNPIVISHLQWPTNYIGWRLQQQIVPLTVGLNTNWDTISSSVFTNDMTFTNSLTTNAVFFRMIYP